MLRGVDRGYIIIGLLSFVVIGMIPILTALLAYGAVTLIRLR